MEGFLFEYSESKNKKLLEERGVGFDDVICILESNGPLAIVEHPNQQRYPGQKMYILDIDGYVYVVLFVETDNKILLKTVFPSRKLTKRYL